MTADQVTRLIDAVAQLLGVLVWPAVVLIVALRFRSPIAGFIKSASQFSVKGAGIEASVTRDREEAVAALGAAVAARISEGGIGAGADLSDVADVMPAPRAQRRLRNSVILWVDDRPGNNRYERQAFEALGMRVDLSTSTEDALSRLGRRHYDLIISDMGRPGDARAGYTLLDRLRSQGDTTPYVIYASSRAPEHVAEALRRGATGCTNSATELVRIVTEALGHRLTPAD
ncbi:MAG: response regulator [Nocardiopsaceae bacterium]|nr:response regulator [Nocardiopsaceae bacterium]